MKMRSFQPALKEIKMNFHNQLESKIECVLFICSFCNSSIEQMLICNHYQSMERPS